MKVTGENYDGLKSFWTKMLRSLHPGLFASGSGDDPVSVLEAYEAKSPSLARKGLESALGDLLEETQDLSVEVVRSADQQLAEAGLPTLTQVRLQFWKRIHAIMDRGRVRSELEYHLMKNVADGADEPQRAKAWAIIGAYELKSSKL